MIFGAVLAGGIGSRMGNVEKPKQYLNIAGKPIIIHTLEKFYVNDKFEKIIVLCPNQWVNHTENLIKKYIGENDKIVVISGLNIQKTLSKSTLPLQVTRLPLSKAAIQETKLL